ncbi:hypothetical protein EAI_06572 [Harpegnathos saltator]|uniref:Uncharacterized protein n=1 Tax=Harpegnathos saltator TaxID=610380 RepID=E2BL02_HARSA|nr:hypothetical protein EAI_06572 [Harpegnathos saltator]
MLMVPLSPRLGCGPFCCLARPPIRLAPASLTTAVKDKPAGVQRGTPAPVVTAVEKSPEKPASPAKATPRVGEIMTPTTRITIQREADEKKEDQPAPLLTYGPDLPPPIIVTLPTGQTAKIPYFAVIISRRYRLTTAGGR